MTLLWDVYMIYTLMESIYECVNSINNTEIKIHCCTLQINVIKYVKLKTLSLPIMQVFNYNSLFFCRIAFEIIQFSMHCNNRIYFKYLEYRKSNWMTFKTSLVVDVLRFPEMIVLVRHFRIHTQLNCGPNEWWEIYFYIVLYYLLWWLQTYIVAIPDIMWWNIFRDNFFTE